MTAIMTCDFACDLGFVSMTAFRVNAVPGHVYVLVTLTDVDDNQRRWEHCLTETNWLHAIRLWLVTLTIESGKRMN